MNLKNENTLTREVSTCKNKRKKEKFFNYFTTSVSCISSYFSYLFFFYKGRKINNTEL